MRQQRSGVILNISSMAAWTVYPWVGYKTTKAAIIGSCTCRQRIIRERVNAVQLSSFTPVKGDLIMAPNLLFYQLLLVALVLICLLIHVGWPDATPRAPARPSHPINPDANAPKNPNPSPGSSTNRSARPVSREPMRAPRRPARHLL